jgi:hypothetical protein
VGIVPWEEGDVALLERLVGDPEMTEHLGGPESPEEIAARQLEYPPGRVLRCSDWRFELFA